MHIPFHFNSFRCSSRATGKIKGTASTRWCAGKEEEEEEEEEKLRKEKMFLCAFFFVCLFAFPLPSFCHVCRDEKSGKKIRFTSHSSCFRFVMCPPKFKNQLFFSLEGFFLHFLIVVRKIM